jgi:hypothetical protein
MSHFTVTDHDTPLSLTISEHSILYNASPHFKLTDTYPTPMHLADSKGPFGSHITAVEVLGGGVRMQVVQQAIIEVLGEVRNEVFCTSDMPYYNVGYH